MYLLKVMQQESFAEEINFLKSVKADKAPRNIPDLVKKLDLFLDDDDLLRSKGRLSRCNYYDFEVLNPIVLCRRHHLTRLYIREAHNECKHLGIQATLTRLRLKGLWVTFARTAIRQELLECIVCRKFNSFAFQYPKFTNLAKAQVELYRPYKHTGIDFTKAFDVKSSGTTTKMYILIFTCLNVRAVHLELVPDMSAPSFVKAFKRFVCHHGVPDFVYSDNARSFTQGMEAIQQCLVSEEGAEFLRRNQIQHRRIPLYSPWVGSMWERLIKVVKISLYKAIGKFVTDYFDFCTLLADIADAINSRPLTYTTNSNDVIPLSPNCFIKNLARTALVLRAPDEEDPAWSAEPARDQLIHTLERSSAKFEAFRVRWYDEYLLSLREAHRDLYQVRWDDVIRVNDIVLISSPAKDRASWPMGVVSKLLHGNDNKVRSAYIRTSSGAINLYPIKLLYPLELSLTHKTTDTTTGQVTDPHLHVLFLNINLLHLLLPLFLSLLPPITMT